MATKLNWVYDDRSGEYHAYHNNHRIRAVLDSCPENPFEDHDGNWPIIVRVPDAFQGTNTYDKTESYPLHLPFGRMKTGQLIHDQVTIAKLFGMSVYEVLDCYVTEQPVHYCLDAEVLQDAFEQALQDRSDRYRLENLEEIYKLIGVPTCRKTVRGCAQGHWAEVLVVATPEAQKAFGCTEVTDEDLESTADLYGWWAYGEVYGYIVEQIVPPEDEDDEPTYEETDSCWGFYGPDFDKSGLEDAALECVPDREETNAVLECA